MSIDVGVESVPREQVPVKCPILTFGDLVRLQLSPQECNEGCHELSVNSKGCSWA